VVKKIWNILGDIKISFVLLMAASATLFTGSLYAGNHYSLFNELNRVRVQDWLADYFGPQSELVWWIPVLFIIMGCLGVNIFICACNRITALIGQRKSGSGHHFFHLLTPSIIHFLFLVIILGHLMTFTLGKWQTAPLKQQNSIEFGEGKQTLRVKSIRDTFFPENSAMRDRIFQTRAILINEEEEEIDLQFTKPAFIDEHYLFLDKKKERKKLESGTKSVEDSQDDENCNKAYIYIEKERDKQEGELLLLIVSDPGLYVIIFGLTSIMVLMIWYFITQKITIKSGEEASDSQAKRSQ
jgi:hypothetical protein